MPASVIEDLLARIDLVALVTGSTRPRSEDDELRLPCPFHRGDTARSLRIDTDARRVACDHCGFGASAIGWLMYHDGATFPEALLTLARLAGIDLDRWVAPETVAGAIDVRRDRLGDVARRWAVELRASTIATDYLEHRGISVPTAARYGLGWAPDDPGTLDGGDSHVRRQLWQDGVLRRCDGHAYEPRFRRRLIFPVREVGGGVVGFGARSLDESGQAHGPKYLNSPASVLFDKAAVLYGLHEALAHDAAPARLVLVEGYLDVVSLAEHGVGNAVASLGTAVTSRQLERAFAHTDELVLCLDGDAAGLRATRRALELALPLLEDGQRLGVVRLPAGQDPDSFVRMRGPSALRALLQSAVPIERALHALLVEDLDLRSIGELARFAAELRPLIAGTRSPRLRAALVARAEETLGIAWPDDALPSCEPSAGLPTHRSTRSAP